MRCFVFFIAVSGIAQPLWFEPNQGQGHRSVEFLARSGGGDVYFGRNRMAVRDVRMELVGGKPKASIELWGATGGRSSYFHWRSGIGWHTGFSPHTCEWVREIYLW